MPRTLLTTLAVVAIVAIDLILLIAAGAPGSRALRPLFNGLIVAMDISVFSSSTWLGLYYLRRRDFLLTAPFLLNVGLFAAALPLRAAGTIFPTLLLSAVDLYWLNLYLVWLARHSGTPPAPRGPTR